MRFPAAIRVGHHVAALSGRDSHGNDIVTYTPPRDALGTPVAVFAIAPAALTEPVTAGHAARVIADYELYVPPGWVPRERDLVDLPDGTRCEVVGGLRDWSQGFHGWTAGGVVSVRRVEG